MSRVTRAEFDWADGHHVFQLNIGQIRELQEKTGCGPQFLAHRLLSDQWLLDDVRETIRLGLIGGGMPASAALALVQRYVDPVPLLENVPAARAIVQVLLVGAPDGEQPGKKKAAKVKKPAPSSQTAD